MTRGRRPPEPEAVPPQPPAQEAVAGHFIPSMGSLDPAFRPMLQGAGPNRLSQLGPRRAESEVDPITGQATIGPDRDFTVFISRYQHLAGLRVSVHKLLDLCAIALTAQNEYRGAGEVRTFVSLDLEEYMRHVGTPLTKPSKDKARIRVKEDLETLYNISLEWREPRGGRLRDYAKMRLITSQGIKSGRILVNFSPEMAAYLTQAYIMHYPLALLKVNDKNANAYAIGRKLLVHYSMNSRKGRPGAAVISVRKILEAAPDIPSREEVMASGRQLDQRIRGPFEKALAALSEIIPSWDYCGPGGRILSPRERSELNFAAFSKAYIKYTVVGPPEARPGPASAPGSRTETGQKHTIR